MKATTTKTTHTPNKSWQKSSKNLRKMVKVKKRKFFTIQRNVFTIKVYDNDNTDTKTQKQIAKRDQIPELE